jgi:hypothetical protein
MRLVAAWLQASMLKSGLTLEDLARTEGEAPTVANVLAALERLKRAGALRGTGGEYVIEDPLLVGYSMATGIKVLIGEVARLTGWQRSNGLTRREGDRAAGRRGGRRLGRLSVRC